MNKQELEKLFEERFFIKNWNIPIKEYVEIKQFIFENIIPEVLKIVIPEENNWSYALYDSGWNDCIFWNKWIIQKAKEQFWIDLYINL